MTPLTSMIRVHDLKDNMKLVGSYDFPEESPLRRYQPQPQSSAMISNETAHLHKLGDKAVGLCRTPKLALFVFKLPDGQLLKQVKFIYSEKATKILRNLPLTFDHSTYGQKLVEDFAKFCGLLRIYEL